jgi:peptide/nickel transport system substrate-binding protein
MGLSASGLALVGFAGCSSDAESPPDAKPRRGGVLQFAVTDAGKSELLDPVQALNQHHGIYCALLWDYLLDFDEAYRPKPRLATSVESNGAATTWRIKLRSDVKFHDGKPFTSKDVAWTVKRILEKKNASPQYGYATRVLDPSRIETPDPQTVVFRLKAPDALFPLLFAVNGSQIVQDGWEPDGVATNAVGTGAFVGQRWKAGNGFEFERNPNYWNGEVYLDGIRSVVIPDPSSKIQSVLSGPSHATDNIPPAQIAIAEGTAGVEVSRVPAFYHTYIVMDTTRKPFDNPDVRTAFKLAANREQTLKNAYAGAGVLGADCSAPVNSPFFPSELRREQDTAKAKELLAGAGYPNGIDIELIAAPVIGGIDDLAVTYAAAAKDAGIRVNIKQWPVDTYFSEVWLKKDFYVDYLVRTHPLKALQLSFVPGAPFNQTFLKDTRAPEFTDRGLAETDSEKRADITREAMTWQADTEGIITPAFLDRITLLKSSVGGVKQTSVGRGRSFANAWLKS